MVEDQQPDRADEPGEEGNAAGSDQDSSDQNKPEQSKPADKPQPYRLGGGSNVPRDPSGPIGGQPQNPFGGSQNPFEALFASLAGGDTNALAAQLQNAFSLLGGAGSMFSGAPASGSGVNWRSPRTLPARSLRPWVRTPPRTALSGARSPRPRRSPRSGSTRPRAFPG